MVFSPESLARHREARHMTQEFLAQRAGLSVHTVRKLEHGRGVDPAASTVHALATVLEVSFEDLMAATA